MILRTWMIRGCVGLLCLGLSSIALAVDVTPSQQVMLDMSDVTTGFGPSQMSTVTQYTANGDGVAVLVEWDETGEGFTRVVFQKENVNADWSAFENFSVTFQPFGQDIGIKSYVQTGDGFAFNESAFTSISVAGGAMSVALDLTSLPDTDNIRQFGWQIFGPGTPSGPISSSVLITPTPGAVQYVPEPAGFAMAGLLGMAMWRAGDAVSRSKFRLINRIYQEGSDL